MISTLLIAEKRSANLQAQEIEKVAARKANVARPDDLFSLPPGQWHMAKLLSQVAATLGVALKAVDTPVLGDA